MGVAHTSSDGELWVLGLDHLLKCVCVGDVGLEGLFWRQCFLTNVDFSYLILVRPGEHNIPQ